MSPLWVAATAGFGVALMPPPRPALRSPPTHGAGAADPRSHWMRRFRVPLALLAAAAAATIVGGALGLAAAPVAAALCWRAIGRTEPPDVRLEREVLARELPHLVRLMGAALSAGAAPGEAAQVVAEALPGPGGARLTRAAAQLRLGADPVTVWEGLAAEPALAPLGRALARGQSSGVSVVASVERLADELARAARADAEDRARRVGVRAAVPLGVCLLPSFLLLGIVPLVGGLLATLRL